MAEGTRSRTMDERLNSQELKLGELASEITRNLSEYTHKFSSMDERMNRIDVRMENMDETLGEVKQLLLSFKSRPSETAPPTTKESGTVCNTGGVLTGESSPTSHPRSEFGDTTTSLSQVTISHPHPVYSMPYHTQGYTQTPNMHYVPHTVTPMTVPTNTQNPYYAPPTYSTISVGQPPPIHPYSSTPQVFIPPYNHFTHQYTNPSYSYSNFTQQPYGNPPTPSFQNHGFNPTPKLTFPKFGGDDPKGWVIRAEQYFEFVNIDEGRKVKMAGQLNGTAPFCYWNRASTLDLEPTYRYERTNRNLTRGIVSG
ncbi:hypothetical protein POM88_021064 [Heracleum sosnowskyi]|uniref:t-SNARE coiled-coil homology domain-containing protein n=1 Tax=Heracleum sosnowskyi TaxID=360622 RepID=A0AAD8MSJ4_9APIA|nr:hypothetical protein POM88_021064 [Heracleum sosnowskyi]